ncbi:helix-turn-helix domain-containing protein [Nocardia brasiliensis]|nr:helix-turn-helix domain-containing protein [Nocardia brasiliensis]
MGSLISARSRCRAAGSDRSARPASRRADRLMRPRTTIALSVGQRLELRRRQRGLSRRTVANLVGRSEEWLRLIESGQRELNNIQDLARLAEVLRIDDPAALIDWPTGGFAPCPPRSNGESHGLRRVLLEHPALRACGDRPIDTCDIDALAVTLDECRMLWASSPYRYSLLSHRLPALVEAVRTAHWQLGDNATAELLIGTYHLTRNFLAACGDHELAAAVSDRAMTTSARYRHPLLMTASSWHVAIELLQTNQPLRCRDVALAAASRVDDAGSPAAEPVILSGALHLLAARATAVAGDARDSAELLRTATHAARRLDTDHLVCEIAFGPAELGVAEIEIALARYDPVRVIELAATTEIVPEQALERRVTRHLCQATAYLIEHNPAAAVLALMEVVAISPEDLRYNADAQQCLHGLIEHDDYLIRAELGRLIELSASTERAYGCSLSRID